MTNKEAAKEIMKFHMKKTYIWKIIKFFGLPIWVRRKINKGANLVKYWGSWDGEIHLCERTEVVIDEEQECDHCLQVHEAGSRMSKLYAVGNGNTYYVCVKCANENTHRYMPEDHNWWETRW